MQDPNVKIKADGFDKQIDFSLLYYYNSGKRLHNMFFMDYIYSTVPVTINCTVKLRRKKGYIYLVRK
jgi:hypothetical protein